MAEASAHRSRRWLVGLGVCALLAGHFALALSGKRLWGTTSDEIVHILSGHAYWALNDYRLQPENGNLPQRWEGLPSWLDGTRLPPASNPYWGISEQWMLGHSYFYEVGNDVERILVRARAMNLCWSLACGTLIFFWARRLFGTAGAFVALGFYCLDPTFLAHGALATSDMCMTFFMLASVGAWWSHLQDGRWRSAALSAVIFGFACVAKFSAVLLLPMFALLIAARAFAGPRPRPRFSGVTLALLAHGAVAILVIWASFGFRYSAAAPGAPAQKQFISEWSVLLEGVGWQGVVIKTLRAWHALPEAFLYGYNHVLAFSQQRGAFLDGEYSTLGWVRFFPLAFLYKTTLALLAALLTGACVVFVRWHLRPDVWRRDLYRVAPLLALFAVYGIFSLTTHLNIGHRHILPLYPILIIFTGAIGWAACRRPHLLGFAAVALLGGAAYETAMIHPHELAYFNAIAGGPAKGARHLVDSSLDWGQGLPELKIWLDEHAGAAPVYLAYFGSGNPRYYHLNARLIVATNGFHWPRSYLALDPGLYCISATVLTHVYSSVRGPWTTELEREYQSLRPLESLFTALDRDVASRDALLRQAPAERWDAGWKRFNTLRLARLCHYLRIRKPDATIGYSIFVYRLTAEEIASATARSLVEWNALLESAARSD